MIFCVDDVEDEHNDNGSMQVKKKKGIRKGIID